MVKEFLCILCPNGCNIEATVDGETLLSLEGNLCKRGEQYVRQELVSPTRTIATSVKVKGGELPLCSVRTDAPIPKDQIFAVMDAIKAVSVDAPVKNGQVLIAQVLGLPCNIVATKTVKAV